MGLRDAAHGRTLGPEASGGAGAAGASGIFLSCRPGSFGPARAEAYRHLAEWGVRHVEIPLPEPARTQSALRDLADHGLRCGSLQVEFQVEDPDAVAHIGQAARRVHEEFGSTRIFTSVHSGPAGPRHAHDVLRRAGDAVARHGVTLMLETHPDLGTNGEVAAATMAAVNHPCVRSNWDAANVFYYNENCDAVAEFEKALPYIGGVHLKDSHGGYRKWDFGALGDGVVPFPRLLRRLTEIGFTGPCTMEIEGVEGEQLTPAEHVARVKRSVDYLRGIGYFPPEPPAA